MCQAIPRLVLEVSGERANVLVDGEPLWVDARAIDGLRPGEYVVVYAGAALERMPEDDAKELLRFYEELEGLLAERARANGLGDDPAEGAGPETVRQ